MASDLEWCTTQSFHLHSFLLLSLTIPLHSSAHQPSTLPHCIYPTKPHTCFEECCSCSRLCDKHTHCDLQCWCWEEGGFDDDFDRISGSGCLLFEVVSVLYSAPPIPVRLWSFQRNPVEWDWIPVDSTGLQTKIEIELESGCVQTVLETNMVYKLTFVVCQ